jgi:hypothetical protein
MHSVKTRMPDTRRKSSDRFIGFSPVLCQCI